MIEVMLTALVQSLVLALITYAVMIPFRLLNFSDLTAEGAYPLGGAISAGLLVAGVPTMIAMLFASLGAGLMGVGSGIICLRLRVNSLLTGIILSMMVYSVNLRIMGKPNIALFDYVKESSTMYSLGFLGLLVLGIIILLNIVLKTEFGLRLRAVGFNPDFAKRQGISITHYTLAGLFLAGCLTGLAGCLMVQLQSYMDVSMGLGIVIHALASLMIGEKLVGTNTLKKQLMAPLVGALIYQQIQGAVLFMGLAPSDLKFFTGALVLLIMAIQKKENEGKASFSH